MIIAIRVLLSFVLLAVTTGPLWSGHENPGLRSIDERWQQLIREGEKAQRERDTNATLAAYEMAADVAEAFDAGDPRLEKSLSHLGFAYVSARRPLDAVEPLTRYVELRRLAPDYRSQKTANALLQVARAFFEVSAVRDGVALVREAIEIKEALADSKPAFMIHDLEMAAAWRGPQDVEDAEALLLHALDICEGERRPSKPCSGRVLLRLGQLYLNHHPPSEKGLEYLRGALEHGEREDPQSTAYRRYLVISQLLRLERYEEAADLNRINVEALRARHGERHRWVAESLHCLGTTLRLTGDLEGAEEVLRESLDIAEVIWGTDHRITRDLRNQLIAIVEERGGAHDLGPAASLEIDPPVPRPCEGDVERAAKVRRLVVADDLEEAIEAAERWVRAAEATHGGEALELTPSLMLLAELLDRRSRFKEALAAEEHILRILQLHVADDDPRLLATLRRVADLLQDNRSRARKSGQPTWEGDDAMKYYKLELSIRTARGESSPEVAELLGHMGFLVSQTDPRLAEEYFARAADVWGDTHGPDSGERFSSLKHQVRCYIRQHKYDEAEVLALELLERSEGDRMPDGYPTTWLLNELRTIYRNTGRRDEADAVEARIAGASE